MNPMAHLVVATASFLKELAHKLGVGYWHIAVRTSKLFLGVLVLALAIGLGGYAVGTGFLVSLGVLLGGVIIALWLLVLMPALILVIEADQRVSSVNKVVTASLFVLFSTLVLSTFVYLSGIWQNPRLFGPLAFAFAAVMIIGVLGGNASRERLSARARTSVIVLAVLFAASSLLPGRAIKALDEIKTGLNVAAPSQLTYSPDMRFFDERTGSPVVWYGRNENGDYDLFDNAGFHPSTGQQLEPITATVIRQLRRRATNTQSSIDAAPAPPAGTSEEKVTEPSASVPVVAEADPPAETPGPLLPSAPPPVEIHSEPEPAPLPPTRVPRYRSAGRPIAPPSLVKATVTTTVAVATDTSRIGDRIPANLTESVQIGGQTLPAGSEVILEVREFNGQINDEPAFIEVVPIGASSAGRRLNVQGEGVRIEPQRRGGNSFLRALGGAAAGAIVGGIVGGKDGAAIGAGAGAVAATLIMRGRHMEVPVGYPLEITLGSNR